MKHINAFESHSRNIGITSLQMIIDMLRSYDYEIVHEASTNIRSINRAIASKSAQSLSRSIYNEDPSDEERYDANLSMGSQSLYGTLVFLYDGDDICDKHPRQEDLEISRSALPLELPAIIVCPSERSMKIISDAIGSLPELSEQVTLIRESCSDPHPLLKLLNLVSNFIISVNEFATACDRVMRNADTLQKIIDIADSYLGLFIDIIDVNGVLLAYTTGTEPVDAINRMLIKNGYLDKEHQVKDDLNNGYLPGRVTSRQGVQIHKAPFTEGVSLITYTIRIRGQYFANIAMECPDQRLTQGLVDTFDIFAGYCERLSMIITRLTPAQDFGIGNFMRTLLSEEKLDPAFLFDQAKKLSIPTSGYFILVSFSIDFDFRDQLELFTHEVDAYLKIPHQTFVNDSSIYALMYGDDYKSVAEEFNRLYNFSFKYGEHLMYSSDIYLSLADTYLAGKEIEAIEKYRRFIEHVRIYTNSKKKSNIFVFLDAFTFYWSDPVADNEIRAFSIERTLINTIAKDDRLNGTDHLILLNAYLINDCKTAAIADRFHMHRNGIQYRIDKIAKMYDLDLNDFITRQYLQVSARVQMVASGKFIQSDNPVISPKLS